MDEAVVITQIVEINGINYAFLQPYGSKFDDIQAALDKLKQDNYAKQQELKNKAQQAQLEQEAANARAEAAQEHGV